MMKKLVMVFAAGVATVFGLFAETYEVATSGELAAAVALGAALVQGAADIPAGFPEPVCAPLGEVKYPARDDAATIVKMIAETKAAGRREVVIPQKNPKHADGLWIIEQAIRVPSGTRIIIDGARLVLADRVFCNVFQNEHARAKDRGKLSAEDRDIEIVGRNGATLDGGNYNGWGEQSLPWKRGMFYADAEHREALAKAGKTLEDNSFVYFHNVKGFRVEGLKLRHQRRWACTFSYCSQGLIRDIRFEADISWVSEDGLDHRPNRVPGRGENLYVKNGDGIDLRQGCNNIRVENLSGWSEDDMLALTNLGPFARDGVWTADPEMPVNKAAAIAAAKIPVLLVYGGADTVVPPEQNCKLFAARFKAAGGELKEIPRGLFGHHPHGLDPDKTAPIVEFF